MVIKFYCRFKDTVIKTDCNGYNLNNSINETYNISTKNLKLLQQQGLALSEIYKMINTAYTFVFTNHKHNIKNIRTF